MSVGINRQAKVVGLALAAVVASSSLALAVSPSEEECVAAGGTFTKEQGEVTCIEEETVGNAPESSNAQRTTKEESGQGNITPKEGELNCSGPPGQQDPECP
jgi:hypothetical protein